MDKPIRVLHAHGWTPNWGGVAAFLLNLCENIDPSQIQIDIAAADASGINIRKDEFSKCNVNIYNFDVKGNTVTRKVKLFFRILKLLQTNSYQIVHVNTGGFFVQLIILCAAKIVGVSIRIAHSHNTGINVGNSFLKRLLISLLRPILLVLATHYFACSQLAAECMFGKKIAYSDKIIIINNGIEAKNFCYNQIIRNIYRQFMDLEDKFVIGHIGRFVHQKNHNFIIDIFNEIYKRAPNSILLLIGDGELLNSIQTKVQQLNLTDSVYFLRSRTDIAELLQAMDVFLFPSNFEGLGIVAIEAQAAGLKIIASDVVPIEAQITDLLEYMSLNQNATQWADKILQSQNNHTRRDTYREIIEAGFDMREVAHFLETFYLEQSAEYEITI